MGCEPQQSSAVARQHDGHRKVRVEVTMECSTDGYTLKLEPTNEGVIDNPKLIVLRLRVIEPHSAPTVITQETAVWEGTIDDQVDTVSVRVDDGPDLPLTITNSD